MPEGVLKKITPTAHDRYKAILYDVLEQGMLFVSSGVH
jgi:hypothetical protein